ncbi:hypothetical protein QTA58_19275 [Neorhizobium sp. CSC1952]|uniref:hypothetical protein n=1 Tax=Neorhizobium sp. CSC1952 TaxID=2978974 RepID=UPI0025A4E9C8|nr:hypothetical protein [Rhizobium sp. CSC1952]WJR66340.1 hypothetical protein QTA58_19275 [Rhizobium sp. CSC1952]
MNYLEDAAHAVGSAIFIAVLFTRLRHSLAAFSLYMLLTGAVIFYFSGPHTLTQTLGVAFICVLALTINYLVNRGFVAKVAEAKGSEIKHLKIDVDDPRFLMIMRLWVFTLLVTLTMRRFIVQGVPLVTQEFYVSWGVNVAFFTVIGFAVALVSLRLPHREDFKDRIGFLFAARVEADPELRNAALEHLSSDIKKLGFVSSRTERKITVIEYNPDYDAYRAYVTVNTTLVNLFGDVEAKDDTNFEIRPDKFEEGKGPVLAGQVISLVVDGTEKISSGPLNIELNSSKKFKEEFTVGRMEKCFTLKYWAWFKTEEPAAFTSRRFCRSFSVTIVNRMKDDASGEVTINRLSNNQKLPTVLRYNEKTVVQEIDNMQPAKRYELFKFDRPAAKALDSSENSPIVKSEADP